MKRKAEKMFQSIFVSVGGDSFEMKIKKMEENNRKKNNAAPNPARNCFGITNL